MTSKSHKTKKRKKSKGARLPLEARVVAARLLGKLIPKYVVISDIDWLRAGNRTYVYVVETNRVTVPNLAHTKKGPQPVRIVRKWSYMERLYSRAASGIIRKLQRRLLREKQDTRVKLIWATARHMAEELNNAENGHGSPGWDKGRDK